MKLRCMINGVEYDIIQGATFSEEYNETLDSGTIILDHVNKIEDLKPYDDVFIYSNPGSFRGYPFDENNPEPYFYKHLLVDQFTEEMINIDKDDVDQYFKYTIQLFSETKKLETIQLPNISVTQPLNYSKKRSIYDYLVSFVNQYSPLIKMQTSANSNTWTYEKKYTVSSSLEAIFGDTFSPDFVMNTPNLRDLLSKLMIVKDRIPYVKDDVIYAMDITARNGEFNTNGVNFITGTMSSDSYCDNLKRNYTEALSQDNSARLVEYLGFRNSDASLMTLENMRIETRFPIYKINKIYMCYYKKIKINFNDTEYAFLCKQDITPLVKLESERNLLSQDWEAFLTADKTNLEEMSKYQMATVGYSIGSKNIIGWGKKYPYPIVGTFWDVTKTYVENLFKIVDGNNPLGMDNYIAQYEKAKQIIGEDTAVFSLYDNGINSIKSPYNDFTNVDNFFYKALEEILVDNDAFSYLNASALKSLFFQVDYNAFYSGAVIQSKDDSRDDIVIGDNQSSSLTLLEQDGIAQKEKANRFANKTLRINARYDGDYKNLQALGSVFSNKSYDDIVIYHREYSIWDNTITAVYYGSKDYVLKNYFTSVFARYRTYNLMSYGESTNRAENKRMLLCFSKDNYNYESENKQFALTNFDNFYSKVLSGLCPIESPYYTGEKINYGYIKFDCPSVLDGSSSSSVEQVLTGGNVATINFNFNITRQQGQNSIFSDFEVTKTSFEVVNLVQGGGGSIQSSNFQMDSNGHVTGIIVFNYGGFNASKLRFYVYYNYKETSYDTNYYGSDINIFNSGLALCFNIKMFDNVSSGVYVSRPTSVFGKYDTGESYQDKITAWKKVLSSFSLEALKEEVIGSRQKWLMTVDDKETGFANTMGFYVCHVDNDDYFGDNNFVLSSDVYDTNYTIGYYSKILKLPQIDINQLLLTNVLGNDYNVLKDNKECLDMTFEIEFYSKDTNVVISPLLTQLSDLLGNHNRFIEDYTINLSEAVLNDDLIQINPNIEGFASAKIFNTVVAQKGYQMMNYNQTVLESYNGSPTWAYPIYVLEISTNVLDEIIERQSNNKVSYFEVDFNFSFWNPSGNGKKAQKNNVYFGKRDFNYGNDLCNEWYEGVASDLEKGRIIVSHRFVSSEIINVVKNGNNYSLDLIGAEYNVCLDDTKIEKVITNIKTIHLTQTTPTDLKVSNTIGTGNIWLCNLVKTNYENLFGDSAIDNGDVLTFYQDSNYNNDLVISSDPISEWGDESFKYGGGPWTFLLNTPHAYYMFTNGTDNLIDGYYYKNGKNDLSEFASYNSLGNGSIVQITDGTSYIFPQNMFVVYSSNVIDKTNMYDQFPNLSSVDGYIPTETQHSFENIFSINDSDVPYIGVNLSYLPSAANSVQYWYLDEKSNSYRFVFGVNVTDADRNAGEIKVYLSLTSTKDARIYDIMHNVIGKNHNYYYNKNDKVYGVQQYFDSVNEYFVKFEPNYPEMGHPSEVRVMEAQTFTKGVQQALSTCAFVRPYYRFVGWSKKASPEEGDTIDFKDEETVMFNENVTLYAIWELIE